MHYLLRTGNIVMPYVEAWREGLKNTCKACPRTLRYLSLTMSYLLISTEKEERESHR